MIRTQLIAVILLLGLIFMLHNKHGEKIKGNDLGPKPAVQSDLASRPAIQFDLTGQPIIGSPAAKVSIVQFGNYKCAACKTWEEDIFPRLKEEIINRGIANFSFINYPFSDSFSRMAAHAGEEVFRQKPGAFWKFHKALYNAQSLDREDWITMPLLLDIAKRSSPDIDLKQLEQAIHNRLNEPAIVQDLNLKNIAKIAGVPKVFVNGKEFEGQWDSYDELKSFIEAIRNEIQ